MNFFKALKDAFAKPWSISRGTALQNYSVNFEEFLKGAYDNPFISKAINEIITDAKTIPFGVYKDKNGEYEKVDNHKVDQWLKNPNSEMTKLDFLEYYINYLYYGGGSLLCKTRGVKVKRLYIYSPDSFDVKRDDNFEISAYRIGDKTISGTQLKNYRLVRATNARDKIAGRNTEFRPVIKSLAKLGDMTNYALNHQNTQLKNSGRRSGIMNYTKIPRKDKLDEYKAKWKAMTTGESTDTTAWVESDKMSFQATDITPKEMDWLESVKYCEEVISQSLGVPIQLISSRGSTFHNMQEAKKKVYVDTVIPLMRTFCENLTLFFQNDLGENEVIWFDISGIEELKEDVMEIAKKLAETLKGKVTQNEFRDILREKTGIDLPKIKGEIGDKIIVSSSDVFLEDLLTEVEVPIDENVDEVLRE